MNVLGRVVRKLGEVVKDSRAMQRIALYAVTVILTGLLFGRALWAAPIPPELREFLEAHNRPDLVAQYLAMPVLTPQQVAERFNSAPGQKVLGAGFYGLVFIDGNEEVIKFSHPITAALGCAELRRDGNHPGDAFMAAVARDYSGLLQNPAFEDLDINKLNGIPGPVGTQFTRDEVYSKFAAAVFLPEIALPTFVSEDGLVFGMHRVPGVTLKKILVSQREGTELHRQYDMGKVWGAVVRLLRTTEDMLKKSGMTVDTFQPANILVNVQDNGEVSVSLRTLDEAIAVLTPEARATLAAAGVIIPAASMKEFFRFVPWPAITSHTVYNSLWGLSYEQAVTFMMTYLGTTDRMLAVGAIASITPLTIVEWPPLADATNVIMAREEIAACAANLKPRPPTE